MNPANIQFEDWGVWFDCIGTAEIKDPDGIAPVCQIQKDHTARVTITWTQNGLGANPGINNWEWRIRAHFESIGPHGDRASVETIVPFTSGNPHTYPPVNVDTNTSTWGKGPYKVAVVIQLFNGAGGAAAPLGIVGMADFSCLNIY